MRRTRVRGDPRPDLADGLLRPQRHQPAGRHVPPTEQPITEVRPMLAGTRTPSRTSAAISYSVAIVFRISSVEDQERRAHLPNRGSSPAAAASFEREHHAREHRLRCPAKIAAIPTRARDPRVDPSRRRCAAGARPAARPQRPADREQRRQRAARTSRSPVRWDHDTNFSAARPAIAVTARFPDSMSEMFEYPTPSVRGSKYPTTPTASPPIAGHHIQCTGRYRTRLPPRTPRVTPTLTTPSSAPIRMYIASAAPVGGAGPASRTPPLPRSTAVARPQPSRSPGG